jgi:hypothetical protein
LGLALEQEALQIQRAGASAEERRQQLAAELVRGRFHR